jgi:hypothetical protein
MGEWMFRPTFLDLDNSWRLILRPNSFTLEEADPSTHLIEDGVGLITGLDDIGK